MADQPTKIREVAWSELFQWLILLRGVRIALMARVLVLGAVGLLVTMLGWWAILGVFSRSSDPIIHTWSGANGYAVWQSAEQNGAEASWVNTAARSADDIFGSAANSSLIRAPLTIWLFFTRPFIQLFHPDLTITGFVFLLVCIAWELVVWGLFGGAIARIAALKFTRDEAPGPMAAVLHAVGKLPSYAMPPFIALLGTAVFSLQLVVLGFVMRLGVLAFLAAIVWPFVILLGLMMAVLLFGALVGWPLMWATVGVEGTDAFDALSRSYAYTYHRPWRLLWYVAFAGFLAVASMFVVKVFASSAVALGNWSISWGLDESTYRRVVSPRKESELASPEVPKIRVGAAEGKAADGAKADADEAASDGPSGLETATRTVIGFWKSVVALVVAGYQAGYFWVSAVGIYLLLRRDIDGVQMSEVYIDEAEEFGLPALAADPATGVPEVAPNTPAVPGDSGG
ncbi:MAG: hypothetical protein IT425_10705 [Pirellulales bacterium]|nr:hypothetical protein [Pirellulales bacterium]